MLTLLVGISGSGKSTWAHRRWLRDPKDTVVISRDKIRELLFGYSEDNIKEYYKRDDIFSCEKQITKYEDTLINEAIQSGKGEIILDATHLKRSYLERFKYWNVPTKLKTFSIDPIEAINRDMKRNRQVGDEVILRQYEQLKSLEKDLISNPIDFTPVTIVNDKSKPPCVIFDIDGTLAHMGDRSPYDWKRVREDSLDDSTATICEELSEAGEVRVIICTGRDGIAKFGTERWLGDYEIPYEDLFIREQGDSRPDWVVKEEMWRKIAEDYYIVGMFDDRLQVVRRARALGLKVFNVEYNNF